MEALDVLFKKVRESAAAPRYATAGSAGCDLCAALEAPFPLGAGERALVPTGLALAVPEGTVAVVAARSGLATRHGIALSNGIGVIDSDYRGEIQVGLYNSSSEPYEIQPGERIAQLVLLPVFAARFLPAQELPESARGEGGFGSTGKQG